MNKVYCIKCNKHKKIKKSKMSYIFDKALVLSIIFNKCGSKDKTIFKEEQSIKIIKMFDLINNIGEC